MSRHSAAGDPVVRAGAPRASKIELVTALCRAKSVLDLGCIDHSRVSIRREDWLHRHIRDVASSCTGVDFLEEDARELNALGYHVIVADVLKDRPPDQYDVVVAGDLIEHLENPSRFLDYVAEALKPDGRAVITTPNPFYLAQTIEVILRRRPMISPEHVAWFDPATLTKLVERSPLAVSQVYWLKPPSWKPLWDMPGRRGRYLQRIFDGPIRLALARRPYLNSDFAAVLEHHRGAEVRFEPKRSAEEVLDYLGW